MPQVVPDYCDFYFGKCICVVCLSRDWAKRIDTRVLTREWTKGREILIVNPVMLTTGSEYIRIPAGIHKVHHQCMEFIDYDYEEIKRFYPKRDYYRSQSNAARILQRDNDGITPVTVPVAEPTITVGV